MGIWEITFYNGTKYTCNSGYILNAIEEALKETGLSHVDIKSVINHH